MDTNRANIKSETDAAKPENIRHCEITCSLNQEIVFALYGNDYILIKSDVATLEQVRNTLSEASANLQEYLSGLKARQTDGLATAT